MQKLEHNKRLIEFRLDRMDQELRDSVAREQQLSEKKAVEAIKTKPRYFYTCAKNKSKIITDNMALTDADGSFENDPPKLCELFNQQFSGVFNAPLRAMAIKDPDSFFSRRMSEHQELSEIQFTEEDIVAAIKTIQPTAAAGPDEFPARLLRSCDNELTKPLQKLFSRSFQTGIIPELMKKGRITPIYKKGLRTEPSNYTAVALNSHITKLMEKNIFEMNSLMNPGQHGFRAGH